MTQASRTRLAESPETAEVAAATQASRTTQAQAGGEAGSTPAAQEAALTARGGVDVGDARRASGATGSGQATTQATTRAAREAQLRDDRELVEAAGVGRLTEERRERVRRRTIDEIPWWYSPWGHLAGTTGIGVLVLVVSTIQLLRLGTLRTSDWLVVPAVFVIANLYEWNVHKHVLHRRRWPFEIIYDKHTPMHHMIYVEKDMALRSPKEFRLILIPAAGVLGIVLAATPMAIAVAHLWSASAGWLFLLTASLYMVTYEVLHLCYHAPADSFVGRLAFIRVMRAHHARHHDPRLMQKWNFNVTLPLFDWILGTIARDGQGGTHGKGKPSPR